MKTTASELLQSRVAQCWCDVRWPTTTVVHDVCHVVVIAHKLSSCTNSILKLVRTERNESDEPNLSRGKGLSHEKCLIRIFFDNDSKRQNGY